MGADLYEAQANIDWAVGQLLPFHQRPGWKPTSRSKYGTYRRQLRRTQLWRSRESCCRFPLASSQAVLPPEDRVSFPIAESGQAPLRNGGAPLLKQLPAEDRGKLL